ncbi:MAG: uroporphyrinogen-III C-methyltransferase [Ardenticatenia bacterium]|jgi:uroporphyrinogen III methyltransferase/synthase|nr:MAG: uroporphyrinogen-III C-methyltransferase [Ardenticatenia bacterium]
MANLISKFSSWSVPVSEESHRRGIVYIVGAGPGDPELITVRGVTCLQRADVVVYDRLIGRLLLAYAPPHAELIDVGKQPHCHVVPQDEINALLIDRARAGKVVVRLKGGDPFVFGRGGEEALALAAAGIPFEIVPGVSSAIAAPAFAGIPVTHRGIACNLAIVTGHRTEDTPEELLCDWEQLARADTVVFLMGMQRLPHIVERLIAHGRAPDTPVAIIQRATFPQQRTVVGTLDTVVSRAVGLRPPVVIVVGEVVRLHETLRWFDMPERRPLLGLRVLNTLPARQGFLLSQALWALGAEIIESIPFHIVRTGERNQLDAVFADLRSTDRYRPAWDWLIFGSSDSVEVFLHRFFDLGYDVRLLSGCRLAALDQLTAQALAAYGLVADCALGEAADPVLALSDCLSPHQRALVLDNRLAAWDVIEVLQSRGVIAENLELHAMLPNELEPSTQSAIEQQVDIAVLANPYTVRGLAMCLGQSQLVEALSGAQIVCLDRITAKTARLEGLHVDAISPGATVEQLARVITDLVRARIYHARLT